MNEKLIIAGFGGQGIMSMGQMLTHAGMMEDKHVSWLPSYGPEMRGGTANCNVIISDGSVASPIVTQATSAIVMNKPSMEKYESYVKAGGVMLVNSSLIDHKAERTDIKTYYIPANEIARSIGNDKIANMVMLGAYLEATGVIKVESVLDALKTVMGEAKAHLIPINREAMARGAECIKE